MSKNTAKPATAKAAIGKARMVTKDSATKKKATENNLGHLSALDAAAIVLTRFGKPMRAGELIAAMAHQKLWTSPGGKTPHATLYAAIVREINEKKGQARFKKVDRGRFAATGK